MKCTYCDEREADVKIPDPNGEDGIWDVCLICEEMIKRQFNFALTGMMAHKSKNDFWKEEHKKAKKSIADLEKETGVETFNAVISKKEVKEK